MLSKGVEGKGTCVLGEEYGGYFENRGESTNTGDFYRGV